MAGRLRAGDAADYAGYAAIMEDDAVDGEVLAEWVVHARAADRAPFDSLTQSLKAKPEHAIKLRVALKRLDLRS